MTVSTLDPKSALVLIDFQKGIISLPLAHPISDVLQNAATLAQAFRQRGRPVVLVNVAGRAPGRTEVTANFDGRPSDWTELAPELNRQRGDHLVTKCSWGAFTATDLETHLRALGITQVVIAGVSTSIGVETTARQAYELGFNVTLAADAMTDTRGEAHDNSLTRIFPRLGETGTTREIIALLDQAANSR